MGSFRSSESQPMKSEVGRLSATDVVKVTKVAEGQNGNSFRLEQMKVATTTLSNAKLHSSYFNNFCLFRYN